MMIVLDFLPARGHRRELLTTTCDAIPPVGARIESSPTTYGPVLVGTAARVEWHTQGNDGLVPWVIVEGVTEQ
jgi:hypothetical protein